MPFDEDRRTRIGSRYLANFSQSVAGFGEERVFVDIKQHVGSQIDSDFLPHHFRSDILKHPAHIKASRVRKQKIDRRDAEHILKLMLENRFPRVWVPSTDHSPRCERVIELEDARHASLAFVFGSRYKCHFRGITDSLLSRRATRRAERWQGPHLGGPSGAGGRQHTPLIQGSHANLTRSCGVDPSSARQRG
jgi:hypothetical protein